MTSSRGAAVDLSGGWTFYGRPESDRETGQGEIALTLRQWGDEIGGELIQTVDPWTRGPPRDPELTRATVSGRIYRDPGAPAVLVVLVRSNIHSGFKAVFTGVLSGDGCELRGHIVNTRGNTGSFRMVRNPSR